MRIFRRQLLQAEALAFAKVLNGEGAGCVRERTRNRVSEVRWNKGREVMGEIRDMMGRGSLRDRLGRSLKAIIRLSL